jgi:hypothetical protein
MVSMDHFRHELLTQLAEAATNGRLEILVNSQELCRSIRNGSSWSSACCNVMESEMKLGDMIIGERANGTGMTVRYLLPREA